MISAPLSPETVTPVLLRLTATTAVAYNGVGSRLTLKQGDLRDPSILPPTSFDLVTGAIDAWGGA